MVLKNYREVLYSNYSTHFSAPTVADDYLVFPGFSEVYSPLPVSREIRVVDLACGRGSWLRWLHRQGYKDLTGVDYSQHDLDAVGLPDCPLVCGDLMAFLEAAEGYDLIHAKDVIEHMTKNEVVSFLMLCRDRLLPGGELWISTFNAFAPMAVQTWHGDFTHETAFSPPGMKQVLHACGFVRVSVECSHPVPSTFRGKVRRWLLWPYTWAAEWGAWLRYGGSRPDCRPTLVARAAVPPVSG